MKKRIYLVFSSTPYKIGKIIRMLTGEAYNHVSIALDRDLRELYGFARRYYRTPLLGGFVKESLSRYHVHGIATQVRVCQVEITQEQYSTLKSRLEQMDMQKEQYLYNHLSVLATPFGRLVKIKDAYICTEFAAEVLHGLGLPLDPNKYYSVETLAAMFAGSEVYRGPMPKADWMDAEYFARRPAPPFASVRTFAQLLKRIGK